MNYRRIAPSLDLPNRPLIPILTLLLLLSSLQWRTCLADTGSGVDLASLRAAATQQHLAESPHWLELLHFRPKVVGWRWESQADDPSFFLSPQGKTDAAAELDATLSAMLQPAAADPDSHAQCRFPARFHWLQSQGEIYRHIPAVDCPKLNTWLQQLNTAEVTLVFASSYLNSPSSMFGHTFLRLDPPNLNPDNLILANTISYAADARAHDSEIMFAYRGIFGGYPGITSVEPYFDKVRLYSKLENRDLWEYRLNLTPEETRQLLRHAWEIKDKRFDYFFFDENCAYRMLALIDVARPGVALIPQVPSLRAIPSDTVRVVVANHLVDSVRFRPAQASVLRHDLQQLSPVQQDWVAKIYDSKTVPPVNAATAPATAESNSNPDSPVAATDFAQLSPAQQAATLETAYELTRYRTLDEKLPREATAGLSYSLLQARSQIHQESGLTPAPAPQVRDDQGHPTGRLSGFWGRSDERNYVDLQIRPAYHDLYDPAPGYRNGSQLQFLNTELRYYSDTDRLELEQLNLVDILSLSPRDRFFHPIAWQAGFGADRQLTRRGTRPLAAYVRGGAGASVNLADGLGYALITAAARVSGQLDNDYQLAPGLQLGWNLQRAWGSINLGEHSQFYPAQVDDPLHRVWANVDWQWRPNWSLSLELAREKSGPVYASTLQGGLRVYF